MTTTALLVTKHHKLGLIAPAFEQIGWDVDATVADTDVLGTFAGDVPRRFSPIETARRKALLGASMRDAGWLLASEGSIDQRVGGITRDVELVVAVERSRGTTIVGSATRLGITAVRFEVDRKTSDEAIARSCAGADLPRHHLLVAPNDGSSPPVAGLSDVEAVLDACHQLRRRRKTLIVQTDLRSHLCPSRQPTITSAAEDLVSRLARPCPRCGRPGFGEEEPILGLPCLVCRQPTQERRALRSRCPWCAFEELNLLSQEGADPLHCWRCNP
jgi:hypothetical protein